MFELDSTSTHTRSPPSPPSQQKNEWTANGKTGHPAAKMEVHIVHNNTGLITNATIVQNTPKVIVRPEEVLIVCLVLILWAGAIMLFFNRWGKIRMLEPYQPKFQQQHRASCPMADVEALVPIHPGGRPKFNRTTMGVSLPCAPSNFGSMAGGGSHLYAVRVIPKLSQTRQNSVFIGPQSITFTRKARSAVDLSSTAVLDESIELV